MNSMTWKVQVQGTATDAEDIINGHVEKRRLSKLHQRISIRLDEATMK